MSRRAPIAAVGLLAAAALLGCHAANEGAIDYRYFPPPDAGALRVAQILGGRLPSPDAPLIDHPLSAGTAQLQRAERKYAAALSPAAAASAIRPGEAYSITLQQAFVSDFAESCMSPSDVIAARGEIAVVASVRELSADAAYGQSYAGDDSLGERPASGRVVFYSGDVAGRDGISRTSDGQYLNFSAVPLHVSPQYGGGPIEIRLFLLELDGAERDRSRELLGTLAAFGDRAYPPSSPVLALLDEMGGALLSAVPDESVEFRYTCVLHATPSGSAAASALPQAHLREGNYVFVKQDHRRVPGPRRVARVAVDTIPGGVARLWGGTADALPDPTAPVDWNRVLFDPLQGRLVAPDHAATRYRFYRDHTYLTLQVRRHEPAGLACEPPPSGPALSELPSSGLPSLAAPPILSGLPGITPPVAVESNGGSTLPIWTHLPHPATPPPSEPPPTND